MASPVISGMMHPWLSGDRTQKTGKDASLAFVSLFEVIVSDAVQNLLEDASLAQRRRSDAKHIQGHIIGPWMRR